MPAAPPRMSQREFVALTGLLMAMAALSIDMLLPAFSDMRETFDLAEDSNKLSLVISLFFVGTAVGTPFFGPISDAIGRKPTLYVAIGLYALGAAMTALAPNLTTVYVGRIIWGIGAAGPSSLSQAILSDRFHGEQLARMVSLVRAIFYLGPVVAPLLGGAILLTASWRVVAAVGLVTAGIVAIWLGRMRETLAPEHRQALSFADTIKSFRIVVGTRQAFGMALAMTFGFGSFLSFLGSSELILDDVFDRGDWFVVYFSATSVLYGLTAFTVSRVVPHIGAVRVLRFAMIVHLCAAVALSAIAVATDGLPGFWVWIPVFTLANMAFLAMEPVAYALALQPLGERAGTVSAVIQFLSSSVGALLAWLIDRSIAGTVTPQAYGYTVYAVLAVASVIWALGDRTSRPSR